VSQAILTLLRVYTAFKPKPPEYELAIAHVPLGQVGLENPIDDRVLEAMCSDQTTRASRSCLHPGLRQNEYAQRSRNARRAT
jgi:hypothetical protein